MENGPTKTKNRRSIRESQDPVPITSESGRSQILVVMGVAGSGKSTLGRALADRLRWPFFEGDELHSPAHVRKMRSGRPLTEADRSPWLKRLRGRIEGLVKEGRSAVMACSALKKSHRDVLRGDSDAVEFIYLKGPVELIRRRLESRQGHFFDASLLQSQLQALEEPRDAVVIDLKRSLAEQISELEQALDRRSAGR